MCTVSDTVHRQQAEPDCACQVCLAAGLDPAAHVLLFALTGARFLGTVPEWLSSALADTASVRALVQAGLAELDQHQQVILTADGAYVAVAELIVFGMMLLADADAEVATSAVVLRGSGAVLD